jgi:hypothetical protein
MAVRVTAGPPSTAASRAASQQQQDLRAHELNLIRKQAANWRNGLAALLGLVAGIAVIKGSSQTSTFPTNIKIAATIGMLAVLAFASVGAFLGMRAAYGLPKRRTLEGDLDGLLAYDRARVRRAVRDLRLTIAATFLAIVSLAFTAAVSWLATPVTNATPSLVRVTTTEGTRLCGQLQAARPGSVVLVSGGHEIVIRASGLSSIAFVHSC